MDKYEREYGIVMAMLDGMFAVQDGGKGSGWFNPDHADRVSEPDYNLSYSEARKKLKAPMGFHSVSGWTEENLRDHYYGTDDDPGHESEYPGWGINNYRYWSEELLKRDPDNDSLFGAEVSGYRLRYCPLTGDFVKEHIAKHIITMFRPKRKKEYYDDEVRRLSE